MTRLHPLTTLLAALLLIVTPASAEDTKQPVPQQAIGEKTMVALYLDVTQIDAEQIEGIGETLLGALGGIAEMQGEAFALPLGDPQEITDTLLTLRGSFLQAGGEALLMTVGMPGEDNWSPPMSLMAKTNDDLDANAMVALLRMMGEGEIEATLESLGSGWQNISLLSKEGEAVTLPLPEPNETAYSAFSKQLSQHDKPVMAVAFRMQDELREMMDLAEQAAKNAQPGPAEDAQGQMAMGMLMGMFKPIRSLDTLGIAVSQADGDSLLVDVQMTFLDTQSAQMFANLYNSILMFAPVMIAGQAQGGGVEGMPDAATINKFFMALKMEVADDTLKLKLDQDFFELAEKMAPLFEGLQGEAGFDDLNL
ncbi:MAG: hypothetical protein AAGC72_13075 [Planctomycetota bacterium]